MVYKGKVMDAIAYQTISISVSATRDDAHGTGGVPDSWTVFIDIPYDGAWSSPWWNLFTTRSDPLKIPKMNVESSLSLQLRVVSAKTRSLLKECCWVDKDDSGGCLTPWFLDVELLYALLSYPNTEDWREERLLYLNEVTKIQMTSHSIEA